MTCGTIGASADLATLILEEEATYGTTPVGNPKFEAIAFVDESLEPTTGTTESNTIEGDRMVPDISRTALGVSGDINVELQYQSAAVDVSEGHDLIWQAAFQSPSWATQIQPAAIVTITFESIATSSSAFAKIVRSAGDFAADGFLVDRMITISGSSEAQNNTYAIIVSVVALEIEVELLSASADFVDDASAGESVVLTQGPDIFAAATCRAFTLEREFTDLTNVFDLFNGCAFNTFGLSIPQEGILTASFGVLGKRSPAAGPTATAGDGAPNAAEANDKMDTVGNPHFFSLDNSSFDIVSMEITGNNNLRQRTKPGTEGAVSLGAGRLSLGGTMRAYFSDHTEFDKYLAFTEFPVNVITQDADTNAYGIQLPAIKFTGGRRVAGGINTDIIAEMTWQAKRDIVGGTMIRMSRFDADDTP